MRLSHTNPLAINQSLHDCAAVREPQDELMMQVEPIDAGRQDRHESRCESQSIYENTVDGEPCRRPFVPFGPMGWRSSRTQTPIFIGG